MDEARGCNKEAVATEVLDAVSDGNDKDKRGRERERKRRQRERKRKRETVEQETARLDAERTRLMTMRQ